MRGFVVAELAAILLDAVTDKDPLVQEQVCSALCALGEAAPEEVLGACEECLRQREKVVPAQRGRAQGGVSVGGRGPPPAVQSVAVGESRIPLRRGISRTDEPPCLVASASAPCGDTGWGPCRIQWSHTLGVLLSPVAGQRLNRSPCRGLCCPPGREVPLPSAAAGRVLHGGGGSGGCPRRLGLSLTLLLPAGGSGAGQGDLCAAYARGDPVGAAGAPPSQRSSWPHCCLLGLGSVALGRCWVPVYCLLSVSACGLGPSR